MLVALPTAMERRSDAWMGDEDVVEALPGAGRLEGGAVETFRALAAGRAVRDPGPFQLLRDLRDERDHVGGQSHTVLPHKYLRSLSLRTIQSGKE